MRCIEFDDVPDGTVIGGHYAGRGVTFAAYLTMGGAPTAAAAYARTWPVSQPPQPPPTEPVSFTGVPYVGDHCVSVHPARGDPWFDDGSGYIEASFLAPQQSVSVLVHTAKRSTLSGHPDSGSGPYLYAYDTAGQLVGQAVGRPGARDEVTGQVLPFMGRQTLHVSSPTDSIARVRFSVYNPGPVRLSGCFDRLCFSGGRHVPLQLPEPAAQSHAHPSPR
jgi:hypothetical protein